MILVDSSVWVAYLRNYNTLATAKLKAAALRHPVHLGDLMLLEVLQGTRDDAHAARIESILRRYIVLPLLDQGVAVEAARNYRKLRSLGITIRKTTDLIIGTFCIEHGYALLHDDRDFLPMERHLGLQTA